MTKEEFNNLQFADKIYDFNGNEFVFLERFDTNNVLYATAHGRTGVIGRGNIHLQKPKKKVKKEVERYIDRFTLRTLRDNRACLATDLHLDDSNGNVNKITITYETEE